MSDRLQKLQNKAVRMIMNLKKENCKSEVALKLLSYILH